MDQRAMVFIGMGLECVAVVFVGVYAGRWADQAYGLGNLGVAVGAIGGFIGWFIHLLVLVKQFTKDEDSSGDTKNQ
jgi:uncharacterized protein YqgC (DUF456 family)